ncbi:MAG: DUF3576 domain-containing protein, partial [Henriciella sp.]
IAGVLGSLFMLSGCAMGGGDDRERQIVEDISGGANPYLWRASLDTFADLPVVSADPFGGVIIYDWKTYDVAPDERIKATVYILDSRLRADGVKVAVFRQAKRDGEWIDVDTAGETGIQLENAILMRARSLKSAELD